MVSPQHSAATMVSPRVIDFSSVTIYNMAASRWGRLLRTTVMVSSLVPQPQSIPPVNGPTVVSVVKI
ncbi:Hypothetical predicted protein, partial [Olea europaea subsp. europaea]